MAAREATVTRQTKETQVELSIRLDGSGRCEIRTGIEFLDHMLNLLGKHALFDLTISAQGDTGVDDHHTVEDVGICLGQALDQALGDRAGIHRFADAAVPMDEALALAALDFSGRGLLVFRAEFPSEKVGGYDVSLTKEFLQAFAAQGKLSLHINVAYGDNAHHMTEALFKALARALAQAVAFRPGESGVPSTKGVL